MIWKLKEYLHFQHRFYIPLLGSFQFLCCLSFFESNVREMIERKYCIDRCVYEMYVLEIVNVKGISNIQ